MHQRIGGDVDLSFLPVGEGIAVGVGELGVGLGGIDDAVGVEVFARDAAFQNHGDGAVAESVAVGVDAEGVGGAELFNAIVEAVAVGVGLHWICFEQVAVEGAVVVLVFAADASHAHRVGAVAQPVAVGVGAVGVALESFVVADDLFVVLHAVGVGVGDQGIGGTPDIAQLLTVAELIAGPKVGVAAVRRGDDDVVEDANTAEIPAGTIVLQRSQYFDNQC